jgi:hypothetical protein
LPTPYCPGSGSAIPSFVRHLDQDARAVARVLLAAARAAVFEVDENLERLLDDLVRAAALEVNDEAHAAGVVLVRRVVQTLLGWESEV